MNLPTEARSILAQLELVSHGTTQAWNSSGGGDSQFRPGQSKDLPPGEQFPPHVQFRMLMLKPGADIYTLIIKAEKALEAITTSDAASKPLTLEEAKIREARIANLVEGGWTWSEIAQRERSTAGEVKKAATRHFARDGDDEAPSDGALEQARRMQAQGCTIRQIEMATKIKRSTLQRKLAA